MKALVRQRAHPEGSMMEGYMVFEAMVYIVEYLPGQTFIKTELDRCIHGDPKSTKKLEGEYLMGKGKSRKIKGNY